MQYDENGNVIDDEDGETIEDYSNAISGAIGTAVYNSAAYVSGKAYNVYEWTTSKIIRRSDDSQGLPM